MTKAASKAKKKSCLIQFFISNNCFAGVNSSDIALSNKCMFHFLSTLSKLWNLYKNTPTNFTGFMLKLGLKNYSENTSTFL